MDAAPSRSSAPSWAAVSAWGAGLLEIALGAGMMTEAGGAARGAGAVLIIIGAGAIGWGAAMLARGRVIAPRASMAGALAGLIAAVVALGIDPVRTSVAAVGAASALLVAVALACGWVVRRQRRGTVRTAQPRLSALLVAAVIVAAVVTPALGATEAGRLAPDHSGHGLVVPGHQH
ncbi:hypothetical protein GCM10009776_24000 [Microbacterium deminutum]|uniref:Histidine kinase n=2 Tax=Microbacterium deminutum TaxID=344164 RepID=A0ABN2QYW5_9MICO